MLQIISVSKSYEKSKALDDISITFPEGKTSALLGHNGAGKSTLIRTILQINQIDSGQIHFHGKKLSSKDIRSFGYLPEERGLYKNMKVLEQLIYFGRLKGLSKEKAKASALIWLEKFKLTSQAQKVTSALSKGMQQKIQFICAVIHDPKVIFLDEPFSGLDPVNNQIFIDIIKSLQNQRKTIILSSHQMNSIEELSDQITLLNNGKKILDGKLQEIKAQFETNLYRIKTSTEIKNGITFKVKSNHEQYDLIELTKTKQEAIDELNNSYELMLFQKDESSLTDIFIKTFKLNS